MFQFWLQLLQMVGFAALAVALLVWFRRGRRVGETPHCAKCDYDLSDGERERCPECGAALANERAIARGDLQHPLSRAVGAGVFAVLAVATAGGAYWQFMYAEQAPSVKPMSMLLAEIAIPRDLPVENSAYDEISRRLKAHPIAELLPDLERHLIQRVDSPPEEGPLTRDEVDLLDPLFRSRSFSRAGAAAFMRHLCRVDVRIPPVIRAGAKCPIVFEQLRRPASRRWMRYWVDFAPGVPSSLNQVVWADPTHTMISGEVQLPDGEHTMEFLITSKIGYIPTDKEPTESDYCVDVYNVARTTRVVEVSQFDQAIASAMHDLLEIPVWATDNPNRADLLVKYRKPVPLEAILSIDVKDGDRRRPLGHVRVAAGETLPLGVRVTSPIFHESSRVTLWARLTPDGPETNSKGERLPAADFGPFQLRQVGAIAVRRVLVAEKADRSRP